MPSATADAEPASKTDGFNALSTFPEFASLPDSAGTGAPLVLQGTIEQLTGGAMPGAHVLLWAWPNNEAVQDMPIGAELDLTPMARTVADSAGRYELRATVTDLLRSLTSPDGLDISLDIFHGDRHYTYLSQVIPTAEGAWVRRLTGLVEPVSEVAQTADNVLDLTLDRTKAIVEGGLGITGRNPVAAEYRKPVPPGCTPFEKIGTERKMMTVATAVARKGVTATVKYEKGATAEVSTGGSVAGGVFSINGSRSRSVRIGGTFPAERATAHRIVNLEYRAEMDHVILRRSCARDFRGNEDVLVVTSPVRSTGGSEVSESRYDLWDCRPGDGRTVSTALEHAVTEKDRAATYSSAFLLQSVGGSGFSGSALSGYSESVGVTYTFSIKRDPKTGKRLINGYMCGDTDVPTAPGQRVQGFQRG
jgi:hypothetical protein